MRFALHLLFLTVLGGMMHATSFGQSGFKEDQLRFPRVRQAYADGGRSLVLLIEAASLDTESLRIYLRAFKKEKQIEVWGIDQEKESYRLLTIYEVCATSGQAGPKRRQGDMQIPEGFYHIDRFNPSSNFYLSLGINYPNRSDRILGDRDRPGGDIFIHGACVTIGCLPITDEKIKELYILCVEACNAGQKSIPVNIFPARMEEESYRALLSDHAGDRDKLELWEELKLAYELFGKSLKLPDITFLSNGRHRVE